MVENINSIKNSFVYLVRDFLRKLITQLILVHRSIQMRNRRIALIVFSEYNFLIL